jgi:hypothetical protein
MATYVNPYVQRRCSRCLLSAGHCDHLNHPGRLPAGRGQRAEVVTVGHARQSREHVAQVNRRILAVALAGDDQRIDDRSQAGVGVADKKPVLFANRRGPDGVFSQIVVD